MKKLPFSLLAVTLACVAGAWLWNSLSVIPIAPGVAAGAGVETAPVAPSTPFEAPEQREGPEPSTKREALAAEVNPVRSISLRGTAVAHTADGAEHRSEDGKFWIRFEWADGARPVQVIGGRWECEVELPEDTPPQALGRASISRIFLRSRRGDPFPETIALSADRDLAVGCLWKSLNRLHVLDTRTGAHLAGVSVLAASAGRLPPTGTGDRVPGESSPFVFEPTLGALAGNDVRAWWVGAPGYEWARIALDHRTGGERTVGLRRAGELQVSWTGDPPAGPVWEVRPLDGPLAGRLVGRQLLAGGTPALFRGLAPGRLEVRLCRTRRGGRLLRSREAIVQAGERTALHLNLEPLDHAPDPVPFGGTLRVHPGWPSAGEWSLAVHRDDPAGAGGWGGKAESNERAVGEVTAHIGEDEVRSWKVDDVLPGRFRIEVRDTAKAPLLQDWVEVGPSGATEVSLRIGAPAELAIDVREGAAARPFLAGADSPGQRGLSLSYRPAGSEASYERVPGELDADTGVFHALLPQGEWELSIFHEDYAWIREPLSLGPTPTSVAVTLEGSSTLELHLTSEGWKIPVEEEWFRALEISDQTGEPIPFGFEMIGTRPGRARLFLANRGSCRLVLPPVNGFAPHAPIEAVLSSTGATRVEVALERLFSGNAGAGD
ncbi:MAG: hypothetical protein CMJ84_07500 [Planctomycetes bacterium]|nr:hypothetical protein [Planctomycetota bacterium]MDP6410403.1 hypothetical protein [Planctomycetota bacterium]